MKLSSFQITDEGHIIEVPAGERSPAWLEDPVHRWIDIEAPREEELIAFLEPLEIDPELLKAPAEQGPLSFGDALEKLLFLRVPTQDPISDGGLTYISLLCMPTTLVTIHQEPLQAISDLAQRLTGPVLLKSATTSALVYQVVARLAAENFFAFAACRQKHDALSKRLIDDADRVSPEDIFTVRREITNIGDANEDHAFCVDVLETLETASCG